MRITEHTPARLAGRGAGHSDATGRRNSTPAAGRPEPLRARLADHRGAAALRAAAERYRAELAALRRDLVGGVAR